MQTESEIEVGSLLDNLRVREKQQFVRVLLVHTSSCIEGKLVLFHARFRVPVLHFILQPSLISVGLCLVILSMWLLPFSCSASYS